MATRKSSASKDFVTVACKHPQGLTIPLEGHAEPVKLHGTHSPFARFGFGMTQVKAETWAAILEQYGERDDIDRHGKPCVVPQAAWLENGVVFAHSSPEATNDEAKDKEDMRVGFEPIDPKAPNAIRGIGVSIMPEGTPDLGRG